MHKVGEKVTSSHSAPRLPGPVSSCSGLRLVLRFTLILWRIENADQCHYCQVTIIFMNYTCFRPGQKRTHTRNPLRQIPLIQIWFPKQQQLSKSSLSILRVDIAQHSVILPLPMEVKQEARSGHGFLGLVVSNISRQKLIGTWTLRIVAWNSL